MQQLVRVVRVCHVCKSLDSVPLCYDIVFREIEPFPPPLSWKSFAPNVPLLFYILQKKKNCLQSCISFQDP
jgi:hypothetical protein